MPRVGTGYDVHQLTEDRKLILGGVTVPHTKGLLGHSDADVLTHAVMDAVLGAAGMGDIGMMFPDSDDTYAGADSIALLREVWRRVSPSYRLGNADAVVVLERPKLKPYIPDMRRCLASAMKAPLERVNVKATTTEKLGFSGREEGIGAQAVVLLEEIKSLS